MPDWSPRIYCHLFASLLWSQVAFLSLMLIITWRQIQLGVGDTDIVFVHLFLCRGGMGRVVEHGKFPFQISEMDFDVFPPKFKEKTHSIPTCKMPKQQTQNSQFGNHHKTVLLLKFSDVYCDKIPIIKISFESFAPLWGGYSSVFFFEK